MDLTTKIAFTILLGVLEDKAAAKKARAAMLKVFVLMWSIFSSDPAFRKVVFSDTTEP